MRRVDLHAREGEETGFCLMNIPTLELPSLLPYAGTCFAARPKKRAVSAACTPSQNHILAALPAEEYERLLPDLESVALPVGSTVYGADERERHLYFLTAGLVARFYVTASGASAEFAVTGREGVIGVAALLGGGSTPSRAVVLNAGHAYRLPSTLLKEEIRHDSALLRLLLRYVHALIAQTGQNAVCNRHHSLEQQLCRWILSCLDRLGSNELVMTHELIAHMLGVRREGVTEAAGRLQHAGLIHCGRGRIAVLDRPGLEARTCECYAVVKRECDRMLPELRRRELYITTRLRPPLFAW